MSKETVCTCASEHDELFEMTDRVEIPTVALSQVGALS